ncbi:MAG: MliC family protein [Gemmatimonadota bacterium]|nr:MAG: MliC family protein [Gemmatimonadota bacterium]
MAATMVYECGDDYRFVARIQGDTAWAFLPGQTVALLQVPAESGAQYELGGMALWIDGEGARLTQGDDAGWECVNNRRRAIWEHAKLNGADFRAVGNEPGWHMELYPDVVVLVADYGAVSYEFATPEPTTDSSAIRTTYHSTNDSHQLTLVIEGRRCRDTMSGEEFAATVTVTIDARTLSGCGRPLH